MFRRVSNESQEVDCIAKCSECELEFVTPMPSQERLNLFYKNYSDIRAEEEVLKRNAIRNLKVLNSFGVGINSTLIDYGSGRNVFVSCGKSMGAKNWRSFDAYTENSKRDVLSPCHYEAVTTWGVLEHVVNPLEFAIDLVRLLRVDGYLFLTTVDINSKIPFRYKVPEHVTYWTHSAMKTLFERVNLSMIEYRPYEMEQCRDVYMNILLRTVPENYKSKVNYEAMPKFVEVPTNEIFVVGKKIA